MRRHVDVGSADKLPSGNWRARYRDSTGRQRTLKGPFKNKDAARAALRLAYADDIRGAPQEDSFSRRRRPFLQYAETVLAAREYAPRTRANQRSLLRGILAEFATRDVADITPDDIRGWWSAKAERQVNRRNALYLLRVVFGSALDDELIKRDPSRAIKRVSAAARPRPTHSIDDYVSVLKHLEPEIRCAVQVAFAAHLRVGELLALQVEDYDPATGWLTIDDAVDLNGQPGPTKTKQCRQVIVLDHGREALEVHLKNGHTGPMFRGEKGERLSRSTLRKAWVAARQAAGLPEFRFHDVRHVGITEVSRTGISIEDLRARSGHASLTALAGYLHTDSQRAYEVARLTNRRLKQAFSRDS